MLNTNESPFPPPPALMDGVARRLSDVAFNRYPDDRAEDLIGGVARRNSWPPEGTWVANGSNEVLLHVFLAFGGHGRTVMTFEPTYSLYSFIARVSGARVTEQRRDDEFAIDVDAALDAIGRERPEIVVVCSPNNPSGGCEPLDAVRVLLAESPGAVVVDEAYIEFAGDDDSVRALLDDYANLVVVRTFSKAWRLAGARLGYLLADPSFVAELARVRLPYSVSAVTQAIGQAALAHADSILDVVREVVQARERITVELAAMGVKAYPSRANFVLFEVDDPDATWRALLERGVLVRNYAGRPRLERCLRVTAGLEEENEAFLAALRDVLDV